MQACTKTFNQWRERIAAKRTHLESARNVVSHRVRKDVVSIAEREKEFVALLLEEIVPVRITVDDAAVQRILEMVPIRVEVSPRE